MFRKVHTFNGKTFSIYHIGGCEGLGQIVQVGPNQFQCLTCRVTAIYDSYDRYESEQNRIGRRYGR